MEPRAQEVPFGPPTVQSIGFIADGKLKRINMMRVEPW